VGLELDFALEVEALDGVDEADQPVGDEIRLVDVRGQPRGHPARHVLHRRRIRDHEPLTGMAVAVALVATPHLAQLDGLDVRLHGWGARRLRRADGSSRTPTSGART